jgi:hypothetical protein
MELAELSLEAAREMARRARMAESAQAKLKLALAYERLAREARDAMTQAAAEAAQAAEARRRRIEHRGELRRAERLRLAPPAGTA